jgi:uncharacterized protein
LGGSRLVVFEKHGDMKMRLLALFLTIVLSSWVASAGPIFLWGPIVPNKVQDQFEGADLEQFDGLLQAHLMINLQKRLLQIDTATILSGVEHRPGKQTWIGEHVGKFLFSASKMYQYSHDPKLKELMDAVALTYISCQLPDGYLGTYLPKDRWTEWDVWAHKYAIIGLINYYSVTGNQSALLAAEKAADLICRTFGDEPSKMDLMSSGDHVGLASGSILEPLVDLYRYTGQLRYLSFARYILRAFEQVNGPKIITNLQKFGTVISVGDAKAYEMMSCFVGMLKFYRLTGEQPFLSVLEGAWQDIVNNRLYITGTASAGELFRGDYELAAEASDNMGEGCVTTTWIQFNEQLLKITGQAKYVEEIEKAIYNQLFGAESPQTGCVSYYTPLQGIKPYRCDQGYSCCLSSVPRGISMIPGLVWGKLRNNGFAIFLYEPGEVKDSIQTQDGSTILLSLTASSKFPLGNDFTYRVNPSSSEKKFALQFRIPSWTANYELSVNGHQEHLINGQFITISRNWKKADEIRIHFDMPVQILQGGRSYPNSVAFKVGPQVLAIDSLIDPTAKSLLPLWIDFTQSYSVEPTDKVLPNGWIGNQAYILRTNGANKKQQFILVPFADAGQFGSRTNVWLPTTVARTTWN